MRLFKKQLVVLTLNVIIFMGLVRLLTRNELNDFNNIFIEVESNYTNIIISEYYESNGGTHKAIELFNGTGSDISLSNYSIVLYTNGVSTVSAYLNLSGTLSDQSTYTIYNGSTSRVPLDGSKLSNSTVINYNGDDVIALYNNGGSPLAGTSGPSGTVNSDMSDETLVDIIGVIGQDGNNSPTNDAFLFTSANNSVNSGTTKDSILVRTRATLSPNTTFTGSEWLSFPVINSVSTGLLEPDSKTTSFGSHTSSTLDKIYAENFSYLLLNSTNNKNGLCTEADLSWSNLQSSFQSLTSNEKVAFKNNSNGSTNNSNALIRYNYLISFNTNLADFVNAV